MQRSRRGGRREDGEKSAVVGKSRSRGQGGRLTKYRPSAQTQISHGPTTPMHAIRLTSRRSLSTVFPGSLLFGSLALALARSPWDSIQPAGGPPWAPAKRTGSADDVEARRLQPPPPAAGYLCSAPSVASRAVARDSFAACGTTVNHPKARPPPPFPVCTWGDRGGVHETAI